MFERYTEKGRRAIFFARYEASAFDWRLALGPWALASLSRVGVRER